MTPRMTVSTLAFHDVTSLLPEGL